MSPVDTPCKYNHGNAASTAFARRTYGGTSTEWNTARSSMRDRAFGTRTPTGPKPVNTSRRGCQPLRTTARRPSSSRRSANRSRYSSNSACSASAISRCAPSRNIVLNKSCPSGWRSGTTVSFFMGGVTPFVGG